MGLKHWQYSDPVKITLVTGVDMSGGGAAKFEYLKPDGTTTGAWTCTIATASTGEIYYTTGATDLDQTGVWVIQPVWYPTGCTNGIPGEKVRLQIDARCKSVAE